MKAWPIKRGTDKDVNSSESCVLVLTCMIRLQVCFSRESLDVIESTSNLRDAMLYYCTIVYLHTCYLPCVGGLVPGGGPPRLAMKPKNELFELSPPSASMTEEGQGRLTLSASCPSPLPSATCKFSRLHGNCPALSCSVRGSVVVLLHRMLREVHSYSEVVLVLLPMRRRALET